MKWIALIIGILLAGSQVRGQDAITTQIMMVKPGPTGPAFVSKTTYTGSGSNSYSFSHDFGSTSNLAVVCVDITWEAITSVTVGGSSTVQEIVRSNAGFGSEIYTQVSPGTGSKTIAVTTTGTANVTITVYAISGANTSTPVATSGWNEGTDTAPTISLSSAANTILIDNLAWDQDDLSATATVGAGQTEDTNYRYAGAYLGACASHKSRTGATTTMSWTLSASRDWAITAITIQ